MNDGKYRILIVDDEANIRSGLAKALCAEADEVATAKDAGEALSLFRQGQQQLVITDLKMPGAVSGLDLTKLVKEECPETLVLMMTAYGTIETAVEAMRHGAHDYINKPVDLAMLRLLVRSAREQHSLVEENRRLRQQLAVAGEFPEMIGQSRAMRGLFDSIRQVSQADVTVMIEGESGSGKELVARAIHNLSARRKGPFVAANMGALPETLIESELFGHEKGAFTGASRQRIGCFEMAQSGTLFLDEVAEMPSKTQLDLLRVLEERKVRRVGGEELISLDVRLIAATHRRIDACVAEGSFREDLYYRLNVVPIRVPPLRDRREDIPLLVKHFLVQAEQRYGKEPKSFAGAAMRTLCDYGWPGNVRQLRNCMERLVVTVEQPVIHVHDLPEEVRTVSRQGFVTMEQAVQQAERSTILAALSECNEHRERAAALLGISVRTLHYKMSRLGL